MKVKFEEKIAKWHKDREMHEIKWKVIGAREVMQKKEYKQKMSIVQQYEELKPLEYISPAKNIQELRTPEKKQPVRIPTPPPVVVEIEPLEQPEKPQSSPPPKKGKKNGAKKEPLPKVPLKPKEPPKPRTPTPEPVPLVKLPPAEFIAAIQNEQRERRQKLQIKE